MVISKGLPAAARSHTRVGVTVGVDLGELVVGMRGREGTEVGSGGVGVELGYGVWCARVAKSCVKCANTVW
jgi:hypothetical protein